MKTGHQIGGAIDLAAYNLRMTIEQIDEPWKIVVGFLLVLLIAYSERISDILNSRVHLSLRSLGGRLIGLVAVLLLV